MKKRLYVLTTVLAAATVLSLSSCLKDSRYVNFAQSKPIANFPLGGQANFGADAILDQTDTITKQFAVDIASATVPTTATTVTLAIDNSIVTTVNNSGGTVTYNTMPTGSFVFNTTSVTIPAGKRTAVVSVTFYKNQLDPSQSYMLPIKIVSASGGAIVSGNFGIHYFHFIGNDFAGSYELIWTRWNAPDTSGTPAYDHLDLGPYTMSPVDPTTAKVASGYYTGIPYTLTFTKTGTGSSATYSNFAVTFTADDIANYWTGGGVTLGSGPFVDPLTGYNPNTQYTYAQALKLFRFYYTTASRAIIDQYIKN